MKEIIIACKTLERELNLALSNLSAEYKIVWIESGLHNTPKKLTSKLQEKLQEIQSDHKRVFLCFGTCGNSVVGLKTGDFELIIPRVDDCITLLLGSLDRRIEISKEKTTYFLTKGWLEGERNIWVEFEYAKEKYGEIVAKEIFETMLSSYERLGILDSGAYNIEEVIKESGIIAETFNLQMEKLTSSVEYITALLTGPWDKERFIKIMPNSQIELEDVELRI